MSERARPLRVFLCHSSGDKPIVRELYRRLSMEGWIDPWLDQEKLYPGHDWDLEIEKAVESADAVIVCLSKGSVTKEGYIQRELRFVLDIALTKPEETIFIIPLRLEECQPPRRLRAYQYVDFFPKDQRERTYKRMLVSLEMRAESLGLKWRKEQSTAHQKETEFGVIGGVREPVAMSGEKSIIPTDVNRIVFGGVEFVRVPAAKFVMGSKDDNELAYDSEKPQHTVDLTYDYWMAKFILTNEQYVQYLGNQKQDVSDWQKKKDHPVVNVSWDDAIAYCEWFNETYQGELKEVGNLTLRLPTEAEWEKAARGAYGNEWPWGNEFDPNKCNSSEGNKGGTTPVGLYSSVGGDSPYGCADMVGNVWEWCNDWYDGDEYKKRAQASVVDPRGPKDGTYRVLRGGAFNSYDRLVRCPFRNRSYYPVAHDLLIGFRVVASPFSTFRTARRPK